MPSCAGHRTESLGGGNEKSPGSRNSSRRRRTPSGRRQRTLRTQRTRTKDQHRGTRGAESAEKKSRQGLWSQSRDWAAASWLPCPCSARASLRCFLSVHAVIPLFRVPGLHVFGSARSFALSVTSDCVALGAPNPRWWCVARRLLGDRAARARGSPPIGISAESAKCVFARVYRMRSVGAPGGRDKSR